MKVFTVTVQQIDHGKPDCRTQKTIQCMQPGIPSRNIHIEVIHFTKDLSRIDENINGCLKDRWNHYFKVVFHKTGSEEQNKRECADTCAFPIVYDNLANQCKDDQDPEYGVYQECFLFCRIWALRYLAYFAGDFI